MSGNGITFSLSDYEVTRNGDVVNKHSGRFLKGQPNGKGYLRVCIGGTLMFIHRLVAGKYVPNPENKPQVNHKDGDKRNNVASNLEWVDNSENRKHAVNAGLHVHGEKCSWAKLTFKEVVYIREHPEISLKDLAIKFNVSVRTISDVRNNKTWKTVEKIC